MIKIEINKVGGGSVYDATSIKKLFFIAKHCMKKPTVLVISAFGKTTNVLEKLAHALFEGSDVDVDEALKKVADFHYNIAKELFSVNHNVFKKISQLLMKIEQSREFLKKIKSLDFIYDQVVPLGETLSSNIISYYFDMKGLKNTMIDASRLIVTDSYFRNPEVLVNHTEKAVKEIFTNQFVEKNQFIITQGFVGKTLIKGIQFPSPVLTTLGREGSDYTAALLANILSASHVNYWKNVKGVMTADPRIDKHAKLISKLSYLKFRKFQEEGVIGQLLHEKALYPLEEAKIPFYIRPFLDYESEGTVVS